MIKLQLWILTKTLWYFLKKRNLAQSIVSIIFLIILLILVMLSFIIGRSFAKYIVSFDSFAPVLLRVTLLSLILALSILSLLSFFIAFLKTLFEKKLTLLYLGTKKTVDIAISVFILTMIIGSWPFLLISLPFFVGLLISKEIGPGDYLLVLTAHIFISIVISALAGVMALITQKIFGRNLKRFFPLVIIIGLTGLYIIFIKIIYPANLSVMPLAYPFLPSTLFVESFLGDMTALYWLIGEAFLSIFIFIIIAKKYYRRSLQIGNEGYLVTGSLHRSHNFSQNITFSLMQKEFLAIIRNPSSYFYLSFIGFLAAILVFFAGKANKLTSDYHNLYGVVKFASHFAISYLLLLFSLRFIFPSATLERPYMWLMISVSEIRYHLLKSKWIFYQLVVFIFIALLAFVTGNTSKLMLLVALGIMMTTVSLVFGQIFIRDLPRSDVEAISTTGPGILLTLISLILGALVSLLLFFVDPSKIYLFLFLITVCFTLISFYFSYDRFQKSDL